MESSFCRPAAAREQEVGHVHAGHQEHQVHADEEEDQHRLDAPDQLVPERDHVAHHASDRVGEALAERVLERGQLLPRLRDRGAVAEPGDGPDPVQVPAGGAVALRLDRDEQACLPSGREGEARRKHAHDRDGLAGEAQRRAEHLGIGAQPRPPEGVGEDDRARAAGLVLAGEEAAAEGRTDPEDVEEVGGNVEGGQLLGIGPPGPRDLRDLVPGDGGEQARGLELAEGLPGERELPPLGVVLDLPEVHQSLRLGVGHAAHQGRVHHGEDGGVEADAEREGDDGHRGEGGAVGQGAEPVAEVLEEGGAHVGPQRRRGRPS